MKPRSPIARKRATPRRIRSPRCTVRGCEQIARIWAADWSVKPIATPPPLEPYGPVPVPQWVSVSQNRLCSKHARHEAARLWSLLVRTGQCDLADWHRSLGVKCGGPICGCHGFGKGAYPSVRYELWNGFSGCSGVNAWMEEHVIEWDDYLRATWGPLYEERRQLALAVRKYDLGEVIADLSAQLAQLRNAA